MTDWAAEAVKNRPWSDHHTSIKQQPRPRPRPRRRPTTTTMRFSLFVGFLFLESRGEFKHKHVFYFCFDFVFCEKQEAVGILQISHKNKLVVHEHWANSRSTSGTSRIIPLRDHHHTTHAPRTHNVPKTTTHCTPHTAHRTPRTAHRAPRTAHRAPRTTHHAPRTAPHRTTLHYTVPYRTAHD